MLRTKTILLTVLLISLIFGSISCNVAQITANNEKISKLSTIAILPFDRSEGILESISLECEESFKNSFIKTGVSIVERKKTAEIIKENELSMISLNYSDRLVNILGAEALLTGQITQYNEEIRDIQYMGYDRDDMGFEITKVIDPKTKEEIKLEKKLIKDKEHILHFKMYLRIISVNTGETLLVMENSFSSKAYAEKGNNIQKSSLIEFKDSIISSMNEELESFLKKSRNIK